MRLPVNRIARCATLAFAVTVGSCSFVKGDSRPAVAATADVSSNGATELGPEGDYPMILGDPFVIDGIEYTPADTWNYDEVGYVSFDAAEGISAAHKTLPLPSYAEVTSLDTGKTLLLRVERRGPMTSTDLLSLSPDAAKLLEVEEGGAIRVRRVNPPEAERAVLRAGSAAPERLATPASLLAVLKKKLPAKGSASLLHRNADLAADRVSSKPEGKPEAPVRIGVDLTGSEAVANPSTQAVPPAAKPPKPSPSRQASSTADAAPKTGFVVQAAAFSVEGNAKRAAKALGGFVVSKGKYFRVQTGPYANRGQADAALAKVQAAGYTDARVTNAG